MQNEQATSTVIVNGEQAKQELTAIEQKARSLKEQLIQANKAGDGKAYDKLSKELKKTQREMKQLNKESFDVKRVLDNLSGSSLKDLEAAQKRLNAQLRSGDIKRNSKDWRENVEAQKKVRAEIRSINSEMQAGEGRLSKFANGFNKYFSSIGAGLAALTGLSLAFRKLSEDVAKMDDIYSDVMKTTGLTREEVVALNEDLKKMDTRTSREQLNMLARDAGKLGISAKKDVLDFVDAGNMINVALGEDLGEDAIKSIGKMVDVYKSSTDQIKGIGLKEQMLAVGSAINELGSTSTASESYLVDFAARLGGVSKQAKISMADILGFASSLDQDMQAVEMSATALQKFIMKLMGDPAKFAKLAGLEVGRFTDLLKTDTNKAIKDVLRALNEQGGFQQLIPIFEEMGLDGARAVGVLSSMAGSIDKIDTAQKIANQSMAEGSSIINEYSIKNNNMKAELDKARKAFQETALELGEKLNPILLTSTRATTYFIKLLVELPKWLKENKGLLITLVSVMTAYIAIANAARIANWALIASEKIKNFWSKANTVATLLQVAATGYLTGSVRAANLAMKAMFETMKLNPYVAVGVALAAMTVGLYKLVSANKAVSQSVRSQIDIQKKADEAFQEQASNVDILVSKIKNENLSNAERIEAISKLKEIIPGYNGMIDQEGRLINDNKTAIDEYIKSLEKQIKLKAVQEELEELIRKKRLQEKQAASTKKEVEDYSGFANTSTYGPMTGGATTQGKLQALQANARNASKALEETVTAIKQLENEMNNSTVRTSSPDGPKKGDQKFIDDELFEWNGKKWNKEIVTPSGSPKTALAKRENEYKKELLLFQELLRSKTISEQLYYTLSEQANINYLESKINLLKKSGEDSIDVELELSNALTKQQENDEKRAAEHKKAMDELMKLPGAVTAEEDVIIDTTQYSLALRLKILEMFHEKGLRSESEYLKELAALYKGNQDEINRYLTDESLKQNQQEFDSGLIGRKQYLENVKNITRQYWEEIYADQADLAEKVLEIANVASNVISTIIEAETLAVENKYKKQIDAAKKNGEDTTALEEKMEEEKKNIKKKYADIDFGITIAKIISETALAIMKAAPNIPLQILTGMQGVAQLALAAQQRQQVKNLWTGGFTDPGGKYEPRGIVHAGEFVANQEAVRNNDLRRLFNLVDYAQKTNTVARIDRKLIAQTVGASGFANGGFTSGTQTPTIINNQGNDQTEILQLLNENKSLLLLLYNLLKKGITAKTYIAGDGGIEEAQDLYNTINKNTRRS